MLLRAMCTLIGASGLAEDRFVNTFYFSSLADLDEAGVAAIDDALFSFYEDPITVGATPRSITQFLNMDGIAADAGLEIKFYDMADVTPRVPLLVSTHDLTPNTVQALPHEVAVCLSYRAVPISGVAPGRRRGRIYIGPLNTSALITTPTLGAQRPNGNITAMLPLLAQRLKTEGNAAGANWCVHSPTSGPTIAYPIAQVACDDAFDTQRRRGLAPTSAAFTTLV